MRLNHEIMDRIRRAVEKALYDSMDDCARCKVCETQVTAVLNAISNVLDWEESGE